MKNFIMACEMKLEMCYDYKQDHWSFELKVLQAKTPPAVQVRRSQEQPAIKGPYT